MKNRFSRKRLLSERKSNRKLIGYARALDGEGDYLNDQICCLNEFGCDSIFSEFISLAEKDKPQLKNALDSLSKGDILIIDKLDRAFYSKNECLQQVNELLQNGCHIKVLSDGLCSFDDRSELFSSFFLLLNGLNNLEQDISKEKKKEMLKNKKIIGSNLGGRPKISQLKESLVLRLRDEGYSYRSIKAQTGVALSTIRRVIKSKDEI